MTPQFVQKLVETPRFCEVGSHSQAEHHSLHCRVGLSGKDDDGHVLGERMRLESSEDVVPLAFRHLQVGDDYVGRSRSRASRGLPEGSCPDQLLYTLRKVIRLVKAPPPKNLPKPASRLSENSM